MQKQCLLCSRTITHHTLCYPCFRQFRDQMHEPWFLALLDLQKTQDMIDKKERFTIDSRTNANLYGNLVQTTPKVHKKSTGRPAIDWIIVNKVLELFDDSIEQARFSDGKRLSVRAISKMLNNKVGKTTVCAILLQYRREIYLSEK